MTYILGLAVLMVWGLIIYRLFAAAGGNDDTIKPLVKDRPKEAYNDYAIVKDTTHLLLNYRDPFGLTKTKDTVATRIPVKIFIHNTVPASPKSVLNWSFLQYSGYIRNPVSNRLVTLVSINGKSEMLTEGEVKDGVRLIKNLRDSIKVTYAGKNKFIAINHRVL